MTQTNGSPKALCWRMGRKVPKKSIGYLDEDHSSGVSSLDKCTLAPSAAARFAWHAAGHLQARSKTVTISVALRARDAFRQETRRHSARPTECSPIVVSGRCAFH
jgi:hypothetical protein